MKQRGAVGWFKHDATHRGLSAWALAGVLIAFYFGLYLTAETKQLGVWLGIARPLGATPAHLADLSADAPVRFALHGVGFVALGALVALLVAAPYALLRASEDGDGEPARARRAVLDVALRTFGLAVFTLFAGVWFAGHLQQHLLPQSAAERWPLWRLGLALLVAAGVFVASALGIARHAHDRGAQIRRASGIVGALWLALLTVLYGTEALRPHGAATGHSFHAFWTLFYASLDSKWTLYGLLYTALVTTGGVFMIGKYLHNRYQVIRTLCVMFVQSTFSFTVPVVLAMFQYPGYYLSYFWPLKIDAFYPDNILRDPTPIILWSFLGSALLVPLLGIFLGKRWYCSWVCGCGGLANTAGEPFRHLGSKSESSWRFERVAIHATLAFAVVTTLLVVLGSFVGHGSHPIGNYWDGHTPEPSHYNFDPTVSGAVASWGARSRYYYGVIVTAVLSGAIGTGLYPLGGTRVWCRNFCPMAAMLGLIQKLGRFRIRVKADMCISCGMCTKYCEMGIDVRSYAQANKTFTRASCVGCGMCAEVCPRGVLSLESKWSRDPQEKSARGPQLVQIRLPARKAA